MVIDLGTGDGRAVLALAGGDQRVFAIGIDANASAMAEASRRAARRGRRQLTNACFIASAAEVLPGPLGGIADLVTVTLPWGSLLRGVLGLDPAVLRGIATLVKEGGRVEVVASVVPNDRVRGIADLEGLEHDVATAWQTVCFDLEAVRRATHQELRATGSTWARRLGDRPAWRFELRRGRKILAAAPRMGDTTA